MEAYIDEMKCLQQNLLEFLESDDDPNEDFDIFNNYMNSIEIDKNRLDFTEFIRLFSKISKNHCIDDVLNSKIQKILIAYKDKIQYYFTNEEIFTFFKSNKRILYFLIQLIILLLIFYTPNMKHSLIISFIQKSSHSFLKKKEISLKNFLMKILKKIEKLEKMNHIFVH